jgi:hypothetical protein
MAPNPELHVRWRETYWWWPKVYASLPIRSKNATDTLAVPVGVYQVHFPPLFNLDTHRWRV